MGRCFLARRLDRRAAGEIGDGQRIIVPGLETGVYTSQELVPDGWLLTGITCDDADSRGDVATATATFQLQEGETVPCTFTNQKLYRSYLPVVLR